MDPDIDAGQSEERGAAGAHVDDVDPPATEDWCFSKVSRAFDRVDGAGRQQLPIELELQRRIDAHAYDVEDLEQDLETLERLEASGLMPRP